jgi:SNF2 family DNA or RNA helicase
MPNWQAGLLPYQIEGVNFLVAKKTDNSNAGLFDDMGLGKTAQAIRAADALNLRRILVVCPAVARINWQREMLNWQIIPRTTFVIKNIKSDIPLEADVVIVSYDMLANPTLRAKILDMGFDLLIIDEAQALKNRTALRTKAVYGERLNGQGGILEATKRTWILTGTPLPNNASEIYTHLRALASERLQTPEGRMTYAQFVKYFCVLDILHFGMRTVERIKGNKNTGELRQRIDGFFIRRKKEDVLTQLPALQWGTIVLEPPKSALKEVMALEKTQAISEVKAVLAAAAANHHNKDGTLSDDILRNADKQALASLRRAVGLAKVEPTSDFIKEELENGAKKIILFCYHREVISQVAEKLKAFSPVVITGDTARNTRQKAIDDFQGKPDIRVFIGQITATNSAITLTASDNVLIMEPSWTPAENVQAAARAHRIGQESSSVLARYVVLAGSIDEDLTRVIIRKSKQISEIML